MATPAKLKRGPASLVGGVAVGLCVLGLWLAIEYRCRSTSGLTTGFGILVAACVAAWVRIADL